jgi:thiamine-phosphate diphosphorylase
LKRLLWIVDAGALAAGIVPAVLRAGVVWLQLRDQTVPPAVWRRHLEAWSVDAGGFDVVVNGGPAWARQARLGAHLKACQPTRSVHERAGWPQFGRSVHDEGEAALARDDRPDYLIAGPVFPTASKPGHPGLGLSGLSAIVERSAGTPVLAVGGVTPARVGAIGGAGAAGVAVLSGISAAADPAAAARAFLEALDAVFLPADAG